MATSGSVDLGANTGSGGGGGGGVSSLNGLTGAIALVPGTGISIVPGAGIITISSTLAGGTVTSVGLALPASVFSISGSPVTSSGTLTGSFINQSANTVFAGPVSGGATTPAFRALVSADIPNNAANTTGTASNITATSNATLVTLSALSLPGAQVTGNIAGTASNITATSNSTLVTLSALSLPGAQVTGNIAGNAGNVTGIVLVAHGGTSNTTAPGARSSTGLNIDQRSTFSNAPYTALSTDRYVAQIGTMSAPQTVTLPLANSVNPGQLLIIGDESGTVTTTNLITVAASGADTIDGAASKTIRTAYGYAYLLSNGVNMWFRPVDGIGSGGTGLSTTPTNGQLLIGNTTSSSYNLNTLTAGPGITITNGAGTIQINNSSIGVGTLTPGLVGDGVDGDAVISVNTTLARDMFYNSLVVKAGITLNTGGFTIFCKTSVTVDATGIISRNGNVGGNSATTAAGAAGAALAGTTVGSSGAGAAGGAGTAAAGGSGATPGAVNGEGGAGGVGGNGGTGSGGVGGSGGNSGTVNIRYFRDVQPNWKYTAVGTFSNTGGGGAGGAAGGGDGTNLGRGGGGGGGGGGGILLFCDSLNNLGTIETLGGNGGNGGAGALGNVGGGSGGGGGGGGKIMIITNTLTSRGSLTVTGGAAGTGTNGAGTGTAGTNGGAGSPGYATTFEASTGTWTTTQ